MEFGPGKLAANYLDDVMVALQIAENELADSERARGLAENVCEWWWNRYKDVTTEEAVFRAGMDRTKMVVDKMHGRGGKEVDKSENEYRERCWFPFIVEGPEPVIDPDLDDWAAEQLRLSCE